MAKPMCYPCLSTLDSGRPRCMYCGRMWTDVVKMLGRYKTWEQMPDCPARPIDAWQPYDLEESPNG